MKKLFVFVLVVSLLAFAGGAWASDAVSHGTDDLVSHGSSGSSSTPAIAPDAATFLSTASKPEAGMITALSLASADYPSDGYARRVLLSGDSTFSTMSSAASKALTGFANKLPSGSQAYSIPQINVPDTVISGEVLQVVMPNTMDLKGVQKLYFYPNPASGDTTSDYMWFIYNSATTSAGKITWTKLTSSSTSADISASSGKRLVLEFVYTTASPFVKVGAVETSANAVNPGVAGAAASSTSGGGLSSSGGGCVAGTSALALAVLGLFIAKRRG